ncbi:MAG TPA: acyltransferase [Mucilaginibacter sp.]|jgi:peptidoglycan/LPS O-acetylase OafA/YrhL|nr:acyltransferase [Mucilaginibacter sp.]
MKKEGKILSIQYLRGLAALGVVFCHYGSSLISYPKLSSIFNFGQTGVYVFFLVSGFIIVYSLIKSGYRPDQFFRFLLKRSIRIDPPYIATILLTIIFFGALSASKGEHIVFNPGQFLAHIFYLVPFTNYPFYNHIFWTLCVEFQFYLIVGLLYFLSAHYIYKSAFLIAFSLTCLIPFSNSYYLVLNYAPIFALGISLVRFYQDRRWKNLLLPILMALFVGYKFGLPIIALLTASCLIIIFFKHSIRLMIILGDISYSLYLIHGLVLIMFVGIGKRLHFDFGHYQLFWLVIEISIAISLAYLFYLVIEKPSVNFSKRVFYKKKSSLGIS